MRGECFCIHWLEGSRTNMQRDIRATNAPVCESIEEGICEMESRCRCGDRPAVHAVRVHRFVLRTIKVVTHSDGVRFACFADVWRNWCVP